jgi:membrane-associated phospholipid phosphatase
VKSVPAADQSLTTPTLVAAQRRALWVEVSGAGLLGFVLVAAFVLASSGSDRLDRDVLVGTVPLRSGFLTRTADVVTALGASPVVLAVAALVALALWRRTRSALPPAVLLGSVAVTAALVFLLKIAVSRPRPPADNLLGPPALDYSFPSGHTTDGSVVYVVSALLLGATVERTARRLLLSLALLVGVAVGLSRLYLGYHWATDVLAGWLLAAAVVGAAASIARAVEPSGHHVAHSPAPPRRVVRSGSGE